MLPQPSSPHLTARTRRDGFGQSARGPSRYIASGRPLPEVGVGLALLWPENDVVLAHAGMETRLRAHDLAVVDRSRPLSLKGRDGWAAQLLDFGVRSFLLRIGRQRRSPMRRIDGSLPLAMLIKRLWSIEREIDAMHIDTELIAPRLTDVIGTLCGILLTRDSDGDLSSHKATTLERAEMLIAANLDQPALSPATLAARMRISTRHLSSLFAAIGTTTTKAILAQRLAHARALLADPANRHRQIAEIAAACGFSDQGYFSRCFRKDQGVTPNAFRNTSISDSSEHSLR